MEQFVPPQFALYEYDDGRAGSGEIRRWFGHWDGLIGEPAEEVTLAWSDGSADVIVCTSGASYTDARFRAVHLALGGDALPIVHRPSGATDTVQAIKRIASARQAWRRIEENIDADNSVLSYTYVDGFLAGFRRLQHGVVFVAAVQRAPTDLRTRLVKDWTPYDRDASRPFTLPE